jgi:hypothetical protein
VHPGGRRGGRRAAALSGVAGRRPVARAGAESPPAAGAAARATGAEVGAAGLGLAATPPCAFASAPSSSTAMTSPTATVAPDCFRTRVMTPADGAGTATVAFSLSTSTTGSSTPTASPSFFSQAPMVACVMDSPSDGTRSSMGMSSISWRSRD